MAADKLKFCRINNRPISPKTQMEQEKRIRREIANSNERRRMQSINAGFQSLRTLLPHHDGEKLSKAAILQHTADYIYQLEQEKTRLLAQNCQLKRLVNSQLGHESDVSIDNCPPLKRAKTEPPTNNGAESSDSSDEGVALCSSPKSAGAIEGAIGEPSTDELRREMVELRVQLDRERRLRMSLEEQTRSLESQLYPERIREIAQNVQLQFETNKIDLSSQESSELVTSDEVIGETIEIETHSCPGSPQDSLSQTSFLFQPPATPVKSANSMNNKTAPDTQSHDSTGSSKVAGNSISKKSNKTMAQPAAIALPIDVPFIAESDGSNPTVTLEILAKGAGAGSYTTAGSTSRQNLDTIVEAIRHLEGDHLFRDDDTTIVVKGDVDDLEGEKVSNGSALSPALRTVLTMSPEQFGAIRHQVIQLKRPNVIVANHA